MRKRFVGLSTLILAPALAFGTPPDEHRGQGYVYFAPGATIFEGESEGTLHIGAGGEGFFTRHLGAGVDAGYVAPYQSFKDGIGTFSPNFVVRFRAKDSKAKAEPFVTGGYTRFFGDGSGNGFNFGGGLNYWFKERIGLRFEVRDNVYVIPSGDALSHFVGFRIGLSFR